MTDSGRGPKDSRRRSAKQSTSSTSSQKRPTSDPHRNENPSPSPRPAALPTRPRLQERTVSEPAKRVHGKNRSSSSNLNVSPASETFLLRPSIDQSGSGFQSPVTARHSPQDGDVRALPGQAGVLDTGELSPAERLATSNVAKDFVANENFTPLYGGPKTANLRGEDVILAVSQQTLPLSTIEAERSEDALIEELVPDANRKQQIESDLITQQQVYPFLTVPSLSAKRSSSSFLNLEDSPRLSFIERFDEDDSAYNAEAENQVSTTKPSSSPNDAVQTFDELTARLLSPASSPSESRFTVTFLTFYRFFAAPSRLLDAIIRHFDSHNRNDITPWVHEPILDRDLTIIDQWITAYPGDFAKQSTRSKLGRFLSRIAEEHGIVEEEQLGGLNEATNLADLLGNAARLAAAASQIRLILDHVQEDDDTDWAYSDDGALRRSRMNTFLSMSSTDSLADSDDSAPPEPLSKVTTTNPAYDAKVIFGGGSTLTLNAMGRSRSTTNQDSSSSSRTLLDIAESANRQAALLSPAPYITFGKLQWRGFLACTDESIAREITRIDWIMFSSIRPRDLIRHVTVPASERNRYRSLENVTRMTDHFNHLAYWVTNVVLFRDKPKHRAQALEKFMRVARKLRELNDYNALGAIIAGIQGTAVYRLGATKELVSQAVQKDFMKLEILMATTKGHWAYRLAWENTSSERIPFLPLHRRDLVVADTAGKTFVALTTAESKSASSTQPDSQTPDLGEAQSAEGERDTKDTKHKPKAKSDKSSGSKSNSKQPSSKGKSLKQSAKPTSPAGSVSLPPSQSSSAQINWHKFSVMGDIILTLHRAQLTPHVGFAENEEVKSLILEHIIIKDDDRLYERSVALEPANTALARVNEGSGPNAGIASALQDPIVRKKVLERIGQLVG